MSPEYGSTCAIFPIDAETLRYLTFTGRPAEQLALVEAYAKEQGLWHDPDAEPNYSETLSLDLSTIEPSIAGPKRPQDRIPLASARRGSGRCSATTSPTRVAAETSTVDEGLEETFRPATRWRSAAATVRAPRRRSPR